MPALSKLMTALWTRGDALPHIPADAPLVSAAAARMALHALIRANELERCFALANEQLAAAEQLPIQAVFASFLIDVFFPRFGAIISAVNNPAQCGPLLTSLVYFISKFPAVTGVAVLDEQLHMQVRRCAAAAKERLREMSFDERTSASAALRADLGSSFDVERVREPHRRTLAALVRTLGELSAGRMPTSRKRAGGLDQSLRGAVRREASSEQEPGRKGSSAVALSRSTSATKVGGVELAKSTSATKIPRTPSEKSEGSASSGASDKRSGGSRVEGGSAGSVIERRDSASRVSASAAKSPSAEAKSERRGSRIGEVKGPAEDERSAAKKERKRDDSDTSAKDKKEKKEEASTREKKEKKGEEDSERKEKKEKKGEEDSERKEKKEKKDKKDDEGSVRKEKKEKRDKKEKKEADSSARKEKKDSEGSVRKEKKEKKEGRGDDEGSERSSREKKPHKKTTE